MGSFFIEGIEIPNKTYNSYIRNIINKVFKILPIYENCLEKKPKDFTILLSYIDKLVTMLVGSELIFQEPEFINLVSVLKGISIEYEKLGQKKMKSLVFHCIDILNKLEK